MRSLRKVIPLLALAVAAPSFGKDTTLQVCTAGGFYSGAEARFLSGLATHILMKKGVLTTDPCRTAWAEAYDVGKSFSFSPPGRGLSKSEHEILKHATQFSERVYAAVSKNME